MNNLGEKKKITSAVQRFHGNRRKMKAMSTAVPYIWHGKAHEMLDQDSKELHAQTLWLRAVVQAGD